MISQLLYSPFEFTWIFNAYCICASIWLVICHMFTVHATDLLYMRQMLHH